MATKSQLVMRTGPNPGKSFSLNKPEMYIGRDISNDIVINDAEVSRKHVRLTAQGERYVIEDLGSTNGTFINGQRIAGPHVLTTGESIQMGENVVVVFEATDFDPDSTAVMTPREAADLAPEKPVEMPAMEQDPAGTMAEMAAAREPEPMPEPMLEPEPEPMPERMSAPPPPPPMPEPAAAPPAREPSATYTGPAMTGDPMAMGEAPEKKSNRTTIIAGCGCLLILLCIAVAAAGYYYYTNSGF